MIIYPKLIVINKGVEVMKKEYVTPIIAGEIFAANEYVAACITGIIQCVYPGTALTKGDNGVYDDYNGQKSGWYTDSEGKVHGICGYDATISFNGDTASGYERNKNGVIQTDRPIFNISGYEQEIGTYNVTWKSTDTAANVTYTHKGRLKISNVDDNHPNHS